MIRHGRFPRRPPLVQSNADARADATGATPSLRRARQAAPPLGQTRELGSRLKRHPLHAAGVDDDGDVRDGHRRLRGVCGEDDFDFVWRRRGERGALVLGRQLAVKRDDARVAHVRHSLFRSRYLGHAGEEHQDGSDGLLAVSLDVARRLVHRGSEEVVVNLVPVAVPSVPSVLFAAAPYPGAEKGGTPRRTPRPPGRFGPGCASTEASAHRAHRRSSR